MELARKPTEPIRAQLGLWDAVSIIVGIIIGAAIYKAPSLIFSNVSGPWTAFGAWLLGGVLSLVGALCFAELASTYPHSGGDYVYLTRALGSGVGFAFAWAQLAVIRTGASIGALSYVFADYADKFWHLGSYSLLIYAAVPIIFLTLINVVGVIPGKRTQNALTAAKVLGLGGILLAGFLWPRADAEVLSPTSASSGSFALAMVFVLYAYAGWHEAAYVAAEVRNGRRNIIRALLLGTAAVTLIYLLVNAAYLVGLGFEGVRRSEAVAADVLSQPLGKFGLRAMSLLVMISALGAINGMIFTGSRIYSAFGADHSIFALLGRWNPRLGTPVWSLLVQALISVGMVFMVEFAKEWKELASRLATSLGMTGMVDATKDAGGFETIVTCTAPVFWFFFLLTGISLFVLRFKDPGRERPFKVPAYPLVPLIFCGSCGYMLYASTEYAYKNVRQEALLVGLLLLAGVPLYLLSRKRVSAEDQVPDEQGV